jgi:Tol biopolymer transport system component
MNLPRLGVLILFAVFIFSFMSLLPHATHATPLRIAAITQLTNHPATDVRPQWSPDEKQIVFQSNRDGPYHIYLMNADGSQQRALTSGSNNDRHPIFTPDGKTILYDSSDGVTEELWALDLATGNKKQLTQLGGLVSFAAPSPDGKNVVFYLYKDEVMNLWTAGIDGSNPKPLTRNLASARNGNCTFACHQAAWSADSQLLAYSGGDHHSIWTMKPDGSDAKRVYADEDHNHFPWFLADGRLGFITEHVNPTRAWTDAWAYDLKTRQRQLLQEQMALQGPFEWSFDNTRVLFHSPRAGNFDLFVIDLTIQEGISALQGTPVPTTRDASAAPNPAPSPTAVFAPAPGSTPEAAPSPTTNAGSASSLLWITLAVTVMVLGIVAFVWIRERR